MRKGIYYTITEEDAGKSVGTFLKGLGYSQNMIDDIKHIKKGLTLDGRSVWAKDMVDSGEILRVKLPKEKNDDIVPEEMPLNIVYEDDDLLVIDKDAGVLVHPTREDTGGTLANGLKFYFKQKKEPFTFRATGRLDRDTSGLMIVPRHGLSAAILGKDAEEHKIRRVYIAAASGDVRDVFPSGEGIIDAPIAKDEGEEILRTVDHESGKEARTRVKILSYNEDFDITVCAVTLETGRTHQIRVHFKYIGHPLAGDFLYNPDYSLIGRTALHSAELSFSHPITKEELTFTAPLPDDMKIFMPDI